MNQINTILEANDIYKTFGATKALRGVDLSLNSGTIHALLGENGAGKSTLVKILSGVIRPDSGIIKINGNEHKFLDVQKSFEYGIRTVYQEMDLIDDMTVIDNLMLAKEISNKFGRLNYSKMVKEINKLADLRGIELPDLGTRVSELDIIHKQIIAIARAVFSGCKILILDEPTAVLNEVERDKLFEIMRNLKSQGSSIVFISHRLEEIFMITDSVTILKDGKLVKTLESSKVSPNKLVELMSGREISKLYPEKATVVGNDLLKLKNFSSGISKNVTLNIRTREIFGIGGLVGQGQEDLIKGLVGLLSHDGEIKKGDRILKIKNIKDAFKNNIAYVSADRQKESLILCRPIFENIIVSILDKVSKNGVIINKEVEKISEEMIGLFSIKTSNKKMPVNSLSGGNQQKVSLSKSLALDPEILILHEPTRGVDIQTRFEIYKVLRRLTKEGKTIIVISSEATELLGLCDRIAVMYEGNLQGILEGEKITEDNLMALANNQEVVV